jgi:hypothetical protein
MEFSAANLGGWILLMVLAGVWLWVQRHHRWPWIVGKNARAAANGSGKRLWLRERLWLGGQHYASVLEVDGQSFLVLVSPQQSRMVPLGCKAPTSVSDEAG